MNNTPRFRSLRGVIAAISLLALAACGTTKDDTADTAAPTTPTEAVEVTTPDTAVTESSVATTDATDTTVAPDTSPLTIGFAYPNNDTTNSELGAVGAPVNAKSAVAGLVAGLNAEGGIAGRQIEVIEYEWNTSSDDWSLDATEACAKFTQDNKVTVVLDAAFGTIGGFRECLESAGVMTIQNINEGSAAAGLASALHANSTAMSTDRNYSAVISGLVDSGYLTADNQIGLIIEACPDNIDAYEATIKPLIDSLGLKAPIESQIDCTAGYSAAVAASAAISNAVLKFSDASVDRTLFISDNEAVALLFFASAASPQQYTPGYMLSSSAQTGALLVSLPADQHPQLHGVGTQPYADTDTAEPTAVEQRCLDLTAAGGVPAATYLDKYIVIGICGPLFLLEAALQGSNGSAEATDLAAAIADLGTSFVGPGVIDGATRFSDTEHDAPAKAQEFSFDDSCGCLKYSGSSVEVP